MSEIETPPALEPEERMSLAERLFNVYATPGDVFEEVAATGHKTGNWLIPMILNAIMAVVAVMVMFSQPAVLNQIREQQSKALQAQVDAGKLTKEQAKSAEDTLERLGPTMIKATGTIGGVIGVATWTVIVAFGLWLLAKTVWKCTVPFTKQMEVAGLASMISLFGGLASMLVVIAKGNMLITPGPALFIENFDPTNKVHLALSSINILTLWYVGVLAIGLAKVTRRSFLDAATWLYGAWLVCRVVSVIAGMAARGI